MDTRGTVYILTGQFDKAIKDLEFSAAAAPSASKYFHLAQARLGAKNRSAADTALKKAKEMGLGVSDTLHPLEQPDYEKLLAELSQR